MNRLNFEAALDGLPNGPGVALDSPDAGSGKGGDIHMVRNRWGLQGTFLAGFAGGALYFDTDATIAASQAYYQSGRARALLPLRRNWQDFNGKPGLHDDLSQNTLWVKGVAAPIYRVWSHMRFDGYQPTKQDLLTVRAIMSRNWDMVDGTQYACNEFGMIAEIFMGALGSKLGRVPRPSDRNEPLMEQFLFWFVCAANQAVEGNGAIFDLIGEAIVMCGIADPLAWALGEDARRFFEQLDARGALEQWERDVWSSPFPPVVDPANS